MKTMFRVQLDHENAKVPKRAHPSDVGFDLYAPEDICIWPHSLEPVNTYVRLELKPGYEGQVRSRSGLAMKKQLFVLNQPGTIDSSYSGHVIVLLYNLNASKVEIKAGERIAQLVIQRVLDVDFEQAESIETETERGENGFGSTDK